jgi:two-component system NarL family response regulator
MPNSIRLLLVEDDELFRLGLAVRLQQEPTLKIVAEAEDGETAVDLANRHPLDLVLLDVGLPRMSGLEACRQIKLQHPNLPILALTSRSDSTLISRLIETGIQGFCLKGIDAQTLILAIRSVVAGASWWDSQATQEIRTAFTPGIADSSSQIKHSLLTEREQEILTLMAAGNSNQDIADRLYIAPGTVRVHVHAIVNKLGVRDRTQAILFWQSKTIDSTLKTIWP